MNNDSGMILSSSVNSDYWSTSEIIQIGGVLEDQSVIQHPPKRELNLFGQINNHTASKFINELRRIQDYDRKIMETNMKLAKDAQIELEPIRVNIMSSGGSIYHGLAIMDCMDETYATIHTHALGLVMSMAVFIYMEGDVRTAGQRARFMIHGPGTYEEGYVKEIKASIEEIDAITKMLDDSLIRNSKITQEMMDDCATCYKFFGYKEALDLGLITLNCYEFPEDKAHDEIETEDEEFDDDAIIDDDLAELYTVEVVVENLNKRELQAVAKKLKVSTAGTKLEIATRILKVARLQLSAKNGDLIVTIKED